MSFFVCLHWYIKLINYQNQKSSRVSSCQGSSSEYLLKWYISQLIAREDNGNNFYNLWLNVEILKAFLALFSNKCIVPWLSNIDLLSESVSFLQAYTLWQIWFVITCLFFKWTESLNYLLFSQCVSEYILKFIDKHELFYFKKGIEMIWSV